MRCTEEEVCRNLSCEVGRQVEWKDVLLAVGEEVAAAVLENDVCAIIELRGAFGLPPFC